MAIYGQAPNQGGISRFDGYGFQNFSVTDKQPIGQILSIEQDQKGTIWAGGVKGLF